MAKVLLGDLQQEQVITQKDVSIYLDREHPSGLTLFRGETVIAMESEHERSRLAAMAARVAPKRFPITAKFAFVGAGTCYLPRIMNMRFRDENPGANKYHIYELYQEVIEFNQSEWGIHAQAWLFSQGDYRQNMTAMYDAIIYDAGADVYDEAFLELHLNPGGILVTVP